MDQKLSFLTKELVDNAVLEIDKNGIPKSREGSTYAILINNKEYPFKLLVTEAAKLAGVRLSSNDFGSSDSNRKGFEEISGYQVIVKENNKSEFVRFKNLLEYFVAHLEFIANQNSIGRGYERYIKPLVDSGNFKTSGQGWNGAAIQQQVQSWDTYPDGKICINIQSNYGSYASVKCYLNWQDTGINILASWNNGEIVGLYQDEFIYWEKPTRRTNTG